MKYVAGFHSFFFNKVAGCIADSEPFLRNLGVMARQKDGWVIVGRDSVETWRWAGRKVKCALEERTCTIALLNERTEDACDRWRWRMAREAAIISSQ